jgi:hypothetical protein
MLSLPRAGLRSKHTQVKCEKCDKWKECAKLPPLQTEHLAK